ncbi:hypothetical protein J2T13_002248 [Paenibacillus sp. DS2015]
MGDATRLESVVSRKGVGDHQADPFTAAGTDFF